MAVVLLRRVLLALSLVPVSVAYGLPTIDQNQPSGPEYMADFSQLDLAQSFQQSNNNVAGAGILLQPNVGTTDIVTISLWDALPNQFGAALLASGSGIATQGSFFDVFWSPVGVTPGQTYYLEFTSLSDTLGIAGDVNGPYPFGDAYANPGFELFEGFDYAFRTYYDPNYVPEPSSLSLAAFALVCGKLVRRRARPQ